MKKALRGIVFAALLILAICVTYRIVSWKDTTGGYLSSVQQLYHTDENLIDVLAVGSSHCYCSVYPDYLWRDKGIAAFDLAISGQDKVSSYYSVVEALKTQKPRVVLVECYGLLYEGYGQEGNKYRNLLSYRLSPDSISLIRNVEQEKPFDYILRWPIVHTRYRELEKNDFSQYPLSVYGRGSNIGWNVGSGPDLQIPLSCAETVELSDENKTWLDSMIALSEKNGFTLVFFAAPMSVGENEQGIFNAAAEYVAGYGIDFVDFGKLSGAVGLDVNTDFEDGNHCNAYGAAKVTGYLGEYLADNFDLADHRGEEAYELWDLSYRYYCRLETERELNGGSIEGMEEYLSRALEDKDLTVILTLEGNWEDYSPELLQCLETLEIEKEEYSQGGKWVWQNGEWILSMNSGDSRVFLLDLSDTDTLRIENRSGKYGVSGIENVMINRETYGRRDSGMTVLLYDNFRGVITGLREQQ